MKATNLEFVTTTIKVLLLCGLVLVISASPALAGTYCCSLAKDGKACNCYLRSIDSVVIGGMKILECERCGADTRRCNCDARVKKDLVVSTLAAPTCSHGAAWGCSKCGHIPPSQGIRDLKDLGRPSPLRPRVTEVPVRRTDQLWRRSHPKTGPSGYPCTRCGKFHELGEKIPVCDRCGGIGFCNCLRSDFPYKIRVQPNVDKQKVGEHLIRRTPVSRSAAGRPQPRENNVNRPRPAPSRGATIQEQLKGVKSLNRFRR